MREIKTGHTYRHFKGHEYLVLLIAKDCDTFEDVVVYTDFESGKYWVRKYAEFAEKLDKQKYPDADQEYRVEIVN